MSKLEKWVIFCDIFIYKLNIWYAEQVYQNLRCIPFSSVAKTVWTVFYFCSNISIEIGFVVDYSKFLFKILGDKFSLKIHKNSGKNLKKSDLAKNYFEKFAKQNFMKKIGKVYFITFFYLLEIF